MSKIFFDSKRSYNQVDHDEFIHVVIQQTDVGPSCLPGSALTMGTTNSRPPAGLAQESISLVQKTYEEMAAQWRLIYLVVGMDQAHESQGRLPEGTWAEGSEGWG